MLRLHLSIHPKISNTGLAESLQVIPGVTQKQQKAYDQPGGPALAQTTTPTQGTSYLQVTLQDSVITAAASLTHAQQLQIEQQL